MVAAGRALLVTGEIFAAAVVAAAGADEVGELVSVPGLGLIGSAAVITLLIGTAARLLLSDRKAAAVDKRWQELAAASAARAAEEEAKRRAAEAREDAAERDNARLRATLVAMGIDPGPLLSDPTNPANVKDSRT